MEPMDAKSLRRITNAALEQMRNERHQQAEELKKQFTEKFNNIIAKFAEESQKTADKGSSYLIVMKLIKGEDYRKEFIQNPNNAVCELDSIHLIGAAKMVYEHLSGKLFKVRFEFDTNRNYSLSPSSETPTILMIACW